LEIAESKSKERDIGGMRAAVRLGMSGTPQPWGRGIEPRPVEIPGIFPDRVRLDAAEVA
jgi:hypothetical protein